MAHNITFDKLSKIEEIAADLDDVINLLLCFEEFCDEGYIPSNSDDKKRITAAICFLGRLPMYKSLVRMSRQLIEERATALFAITEQN